MFRTVYIEVKRNIPFSTHPDIVLLQEMNGISMGCHHYDRKSATLMMELMSSTMHETFIKHLVSKNLPLSIILDGSTDSSENHFLIVYFQAMEENVPIVYFYKLIEISVDETAAGYFKSLADSFIEEERDLYNHLRHNLIGFASDGAAVMMGKHNGLIKHFQDFTNRPIYAIHCMAHRLHLAILRSFKSEPYFGKFENLFNDLYRFYNLHGHKRKAHLRATSKRLHEVMYELNYIFHVRWIASELNMLNNVNKMWHLVVTDLELISNDKQFDIKTQKKAKDLYLQLKGKGFLLIFNFVIDVLQHLSEWSKRMQKRTGLLVDFADFNKKIINSFTILKTNDGADLLSFLKDAKCQDRPCLTYDKYYETPIVTYKMVELQPDNHIYNVPWLSIIREKFLDNLIAEINSYFPSTELEDFNIFSPARIPSDESETLTYGIKEINSLCTYFNWDDCKKLLKDWTSLLDSMINSDILCDLKNRNTSPFAFWSQFLKTKNIAWTDRTKKLINTVLVLPIGSADAERGFSIMNHIKSPRRAQITTNHLNDMLRIRINGPNDINKFGPRKYAQIWINKGHLRTDDPTRKKPRRAETSLLDKEELEKNYLPQSTLF